MKKVWNNSFFLASMMTVLSLIIQSRISLYCSGIDGYLISMVSNGCYGKNNYCLFIHPFISYVCGKLSIILPSADCYSFIIISFMVFSLFSLYYIIFSQVKVFYKRAVLILTVMCYVFSTCNGLTMRFTIQAGFCMFVGLLLLALALHGNKKIYVVPGTCCCIFGCMIRENAAFTLIPFFGLVLFYELLSKRNSLREFFLKCFKYVGIPIVCIIALFLTNKLFYNQTEYVESVKYNEARSSLVDYPVKEWKDIQEKATGYSENDYYAVTHYVWEDSDIVDSKYLSTISDIANNNFFTQVREIDTILSKIKFSIKIILYNLCINFIKTVWFETGLLILIFSVYLFMKYKDLWVRLVLVFNLMGYFIILVFFSLLGRALALKELLMCGNLLVLFYLIFVLNGTEKSNVNHKSNAVKIVLVAYITVQPFLAQKWFSPVFSGLKFASDCNIVDSQLVDVVEKEIYGIYSGIPFLDGNHNAFIELFSAKESSESSFLLENAVEEKELYIWNIWNYDDELSNLQKSNKLPSKKMLSHHVAMGEWVSGQIYFKEHLENIGVYNLMKSLLDRPSTFYVGKDEQIVYQWLKEHYSENVKMEYVKNIGPYRVWSYYIG